MAKPSRSLDDAKNWRDKASHSRAVAECLSDPESRRLMLQIAEIYDRLVEHAEKRQKPK